MSSNKKSLKLWSKIYLPLKTTRKPNYQQKKELFKTKITPNEKSEPHNQL